MRGGFSQAGLDPLQRPDTLAFEIAFSGSRENRLGGKAVLNPQCVLHDPFQPLMLDFRHVSNVTNFSKIANRKACLKFVARIIHCPA
jgi:hypothetical protein